jgi:hypothetical protein
MMWIASPQEMLEMLKALAQDEPVTPSWGESAKHMFV